MTKSAAPPDETERARALDVTRSCLVQAPAGSGKTELLVRRILALLATVDHPEEIIAITFTRKAAAEMRDRVLDALARAAGDGDEEDDYAARLARAVLARDASLGWGLRLNPARLRVRTIDGLCAAICRRIPLSAGVGATFPVADDPRPLYREAARETLRLLHDDNPWRDALRRLLTHLDNDIEAVEALLVNLLARRDQWLAHIGGKHDNLRKLLESGLERLIEQRLGIVTALFPAAQIDEFLALLRYAAGNRLPSDDEAPWRALAQATELASPRATNAWWWRAVSRLLLTQKGEPRRRFTVSEGFPAGESRPDKVICTRFKERMAAFMELFANDPAFIAALSKVMSLPDARYDEIQWSALDALVRCLRVAAAQLNLVFKARGRVDFAALSHAAMQGLGEPDSPSDLALALDYQVRHILVDEFQDTSWTQFALLNALVAGWQSGDGRTLFLVGDPMQSIYRFREADVGVFLHAGTYGVADVKLDALRLTANFRAQAGLVSWTNDAFDAGTSDDDVESGAIAFRRSEAVRPALPTPAVSVYPLTEADKHAEADEVIRIIEHARHRSPSASIGVLVRSRSHLSVLLPRLRARIGAVQALEIESLAHRAVVRDLTALTRALLQPADSVAWLALLRAPWCGLSLADLEHCARLAQSARTTLMGALTHESWADGLSPDGRQRVARLRATLCRFVEDRERSSLRRWVEGAWLALGGPAIADDEIALDDAQAFFGLLEHWERQGQRADLDSLLVRVESLHARAPAAPGSAIHVLTIHRAKGLEFDVVILPGLGNSPKKDSHGLLRWLVRPRRGQGTDVVIATLASNRSPDDPVYQLLADIDRTRAEHESRRLLYVAVTRAKAELHLLAHTRTDGQGVAVPQPGSLLKHLWPTVAASFQAATTVPKATLQAVTPVLPSRLPADWSLPVMSAVAINTVHSNLDDSPPPIEFSWVTDVARKVGIVVHRALQLIGREGLAKWNPRRVVARESAFRTQLQSLGVSPTQLAASCARVIEAVQGVLSDERGRWILDDHVQGRVEWRLSGVLGDRIQTLAIDRAFMDQSGTRWIIDYKVSQHAGADLQAFLDRECERYLPQLTMYQEIVSQLEPASTIRAGLYFPLMKAWREVSPFGSGKAGG